MLLSGSQVGGKEAYFTEGNIVARTNGGYKIPVLRIIPPSFSIFFFIPRNVVYNLLTEWCGL